MICKVDRHQNHVSLSFIVYILLLFWTQTSFADNIPYIYQKIAYENHIPPVILYGIALTESGKTLRTNKYRPWPWTLNVAGVPRRYSSRKAAWKGLLFYLQQGIKSIDVGIMQVNWKYHHKKLGTPWQALEPVNNTQTGARILSAEYNKTGLWKTAIGRYHSPGRKPVQQKRAENYTRRVLNQLKRIGKTNAF